MNQTTSPSLEINHSADFSSWLHDCGSGLAFTTYQAGKVFLLGTRPDRKLSVFERTLERCMGMFTTANSMIISDRNQIYRFENALADGELAKGELASDGYDRLYLPQTSHFTGDLDIHDIVVDGAGRVLFANTLFNCVAAVSPSHSFRPIWQPPFVDGLSVGDRCHLNGLALRDGKLRYVTATSTSNEVNGWRQQRQDGGVVIDVNDNSIIARGLSMPHSPRWHDGRLWLLDSGTGRLGFVSSDNGKFQAVAFCPGYLRGLCFIGDHAIVGLSLPRGSDAYDGLPLQDVLAEIGREARCGLHVINTKTGKTEHWLHLTGIVSELYDVCLLPGARRPSLVGFRNDDLNHMITIDV